MVSLETAWRGWGQWANLGMVEKRGLPLDLLPGGTGWMAGWWQMNAMEAEPEERRGRRDQTREPMSF
jgi:hypothetical protein